MENKYKQDGEDICCANCGITAKEFFEYVSDDVPSNDCWFAGTSWYCSDDCYDEHTKNED
jgi:hypothetical protein